MKKLLIFIVVLVLISVFYMNGCSTQQLSKQNDQSHENTTQNPVAKDESPQTKPSADSSENPSSIKSLEPEITGKLSYDIKDAEGKDLTKVEYRYLSKEGELVSVVATFGSKRPRQMERHIQSHTSDIEDF